MFGTLPRAAILHVLPLSQLLDLYDADQDIATLLQLHHFKNGTSKTSVVVSALRAGNIVLNTSTAKAMGYIARLFGLDGATANLHHIQDYTQRMVDGWSVNTAIIMSDVRTNGRIAGAFAEALDSRVHRK